LENGGRFPQDGRSLMVRGGYDLEGHGSIPRLEAAMLQNDLFTLAFGLAEPWFASDVRLELKDEAGREFGELHITPDFRPGGRGPTGASEESTGSHRRTGKGEGDPEGETGGACLDDGSRCACDEDGGRGFPSSLQRPFSSDTEWQAVVGVAVNAAGNDQSELVPMVDEIEERYGIVPVEVLADGGYNAHSNLEALEGRTTVIAPAPQPKDATVDPYRPKETDSPAVARWQKRMGTARAKRIYRERAATAECVNAQARNRGLLRFLLRGLEKVKAVVLWYALAHNMTRMIAYEMLGEATA
jgi:Transposase DDE domain